MPLLPLIEPAFAFPFGFALGVLLTGRSRGAGDCRTGLGFVVGPVWPEDALPPRDVVAPLFAARGLDRPWPDDFPSARPFAPAVADLPRLVDDRRVVGVRTCPGAGPPRARS